MAACFLPFLPFLSLLPSIPVLSALLATSALNWSELHSAGRTDHRIGVRVILFDGVQEWVSWDERDAPE